MSEIVVKQTNEPPCKEKIQTSRRMELRDDFALTGFAASSSLFLIDCLWLLVSHIRNAHVEWFMLTIGSLLAAISLMAAVQLGAELEVFKASKENFPEFSIQSMSIIVPVGIWSAAFFHADSYLPSCLGLFLLGLSSFVWTLCGMFRLQLAANHLKQRGESILKAR